MGGDAQRHTSQSRGRWAPSTARDIDWKSSYTRVSPASMSRRTSTSRPRQAAVSGRAVPDGALAQRQGLRGLSTVLPGPRHSLGYVVLAFDPMGARRADLLSRLLTVASRLGADEEHTYPGRQMILKGITHTRLQTWDSIRSLDYLASHPLVDPKAPGLDRSIGRRNHHDAARRGGRPACRGRALLRQHRERGLRELHPAGLDRRRRAGSHRVRPGGFRSLGPALSAGPEASARAGQRTRLLRDVLAELHHQRHRGVPQAPRLSIRLWATPSASRGTDRHCPTGFLTRCGSRSIPGSGVAQGRFPARDPRARARDRAGQYALRLRVRAASFGRFGERLPSRSSGSTPSASGPPIWQPCWESRSPVPRAGRQRSPLHPSATRGWRSWSSTRPRRYGCPPGCSCQRKRSQAAADHRARTVRPRRAVGGRRYPAGSRRRAARPARRPAWPG